MSATKSVTFSEDVEVSGKPFRFQQMRGHLTYRGWLDKAAFKEWIQAKCPTLKTIYMAHEEGKADEATPYQHTHVCLEWMANFSTKDCRFFDYQGTHPHIKKIKTAKHWMNAVRYMSKEDPENESLKTFLGEIAEGFDVEELWTSENLAQALVRYCKKPGDAGGIKTVWEAKPLTMAKKEPKELRPWQQVVWDRTRGPGDDRTFFFVIDALGKQGKSTLLKELSWHDTGRTCMLTLGRECDMLESLYGYLERGVRVEVVVVDCPRGTFFTREHFCTLEAIKNACWTKTKYKVVPVLLDYHPHIIVFSNRNVVEICGKWMTADRYSGIELIPGGYREINPVDELVEFPGYPDDGAVQAIRRAHKFSADDY